MKRNALAIVVLCLTMALQMSAQTASTANSTPKSNPNATAKPAATPSTTTTATTSTPAANPATNATSKPEPKHVISWDGTGDWQTPEGDHRFGHNREDRWPSEIIMTPAERHDEKAREYEESSNLPSEGNSTSQGQHERLRCAGPERHPCTEWEVREMHRRLEERREEHPELAHIRILVLETREGAVACRQHDDAPCTQEQVRALNEHVAEPMRCALYFGTPRASTGTSTATSQNHHPSTQNHPATTNTNGPSGTSTSTSAASSTGSTEQGGTSAQSHASTTQNQSQSTGNHSASHNATAPNHPVATNYHTPPKAQ